MKAASKCVLFSRVTVDKKTHQHPIAVFSTDKDAKSYAVALNSAITSGDAAVAKSLDDGVVMDTDGKLVPGVKFSVVSLPYSPDLAAGDDSIFE